jgi:putative hydrolase of the HAD superfamily
MTKTADNIIFDLGGVIINLSFQKMVDEFNKIKIGGKDFNTLYSKHKQNPLFDLFETGKITEADFRAQLQALLEINITDEQFDQCWNSILLDIPQERIQLLQQIGKSKRIFLLSNTNAIHKTCFDALVKKQFGLESLDSLFEKAYYSHLVGDRKPNASIFELVVNENKLDKSKTLFIDDSIQHIEGAKLVGLNTYHLIEPDNIVALFS